jgi:hypothetical protein
MKDFLTTRKQLLKAVAQETARMSYPGRMGGIVKAGTKKAVEEYFVGDFPIEEIWDEAGQIRRRFDQWHEKRVHELGGRIQRLGLVKKKSDLREALAAKFLNTYMHQLMKYEQCRLLWDELHLPLDKRILVALSRLQRGMKSSASKRVATILRKPPYSLPYREYIEVQRALTDFIDELNARTRCQIKLRSRIELNLLWAE